MALLRLAVLLVAVVAVVTAQYGYAPESYDHAPAKYDFHYSVYDPHTYDIKSQHESRDGDTVYGEYELYEPDGTKRVVKYSDTGYGFQADVIRTPAAYPKY